MKVFRASSKSNVSTIPHEVRPILEHAQKLATCIREEKLEEAEKICQDLLLLIQLLSSCDLRPAVEYKDWTVESFTSALKANCPPYPINMVNAFHSLVEKMLKNIQEQLIKKGTKAARRDVTSFISLLEVINNFDPAVISECASIVDQQCQILENLARSRKPPSSTLLARAVKTLNPHQASLSERRVTIQVGERTITCWLFAFYLRASERLQKEKKLEPLSDGAFKLLDDYLSMRQIDWTSISTDTLEELAPYTKPHK